MSYTREERLDIGKQIYNNEISKTDAALFQVPEKPVRGIVAVAWFPAVSYRQGWL